MDEADKQGPREDPTYWKGIEGMAEVVCMHGVHFLRIAGIDVAMQGDRCPDRRLLPRLGHGTWTAEKIRIAASIINNKLMEQAACRARRRPRPRPVRPSVSPDRRASGST